MIVSTTVLQTTPSSRRNARARSFLTPCMRCNVCIATGTRAELSRGTAESGRRYRRRPPAREVDAVLAADHDQIVSSRMRTVWVKPGCYEGVRD